MLLCGDIFESAKDSTMYVVPREPFFNRNRRKY